MQRWGLVQDGPWTSGLTEGQNWAGQDILLGFLVETYNDGKESMRNLVNQWRPKKTKFQGDPKRPIKTSDHQLYYTPSQKLDTSYEGISLDLVTSDAGGWDLGPKKQGY